MLYKIELFKNIIMNKGDKSAGDKSKEDLSKSLDDRSQAYNPNSDKHNPSTADKKGGHASMDSHTNASNAYKTLHQDDKK
jgi:hypothetical protein